VSEGATASGVRRIEAVTGLNALAVAQQQSDRLQQLADLLRASPADLLAKVEQLAHKSREQEKAIERLQQKLASGSGSDLADQVQEIKGVKLLVARLDGTDAKVLRTTLDKLKDKLGEAVILLASVQDDKIALVAGVTQNLTARVKAGDLLGKVAAAVGGKGGGRADMAQGGGTDVAALPAALEKVSVWLAESLA
jgi:alanyl-tRNA synthetase